MKEVVVYDHLHAVHVSTEILHLCPEDEISPLSVRQEDDEEHHRESC